MDLRNTNTPKKKKHSAVAIPAKPALRSALKHNPPTPSPSPETHAYSATSGAVREYVEMWDYAGGARFRGFVVEKGDERSLFIFFDREVLEQDLKPG